jgi:hypothetical protein
MNIPDSKAQAQARCTGGTHRSAREVGTPLGIKDLPGEPALAACARYLEINFGGSDFGGDPDSDSKDRILLAMSQETGLVKASEFGAAPLQRPLSE